uniref:Poly polymerase n=1 Tax=Brassica campestris TaxID=3711 RepID=M4CHN1_BRACM
MGLCVSVGRSDCDSSPAAKIVTVNGDLREYNVPVLASQVLEAESMASSSSSRPSSYFLCNSDSLYYDDFIPAIEPEEILQADQIYFVLPVSKRQYRLTASDMAALAVKASVAMEKAAKNNNRRRKSGRISPVMTLNQPNERLVAVNRSSMMMMQKGNLPNKTTQFKSTDTISYYRSGSVRQLKRYASGKARKLAARSIKRLSTIHEENIF